MLHPKTFRSTENELVFRFPYRQERVFLCWQNDRRNLFHLFYLFLLSQWWNNENIILTICITFDVAQRLINQKFPKAGRQNCNKVLRSKKTNNNLSLFIFERRNMRKYWFLNRILYNPLPTTALNHKTRLHAVMIGSCQGDDTFLEKRGILLFSKMSQGIHFFIREFYSPSSPFNDWMKMRNKRGLWKVYDRSVGVTKRHPPTKKTKIPGIWN